MSDEQNQKVIKELTPEQIALMPVVRDEWVVRGRCVAPEIDKEKAREAVKQAYKCAGVDPPEDDLFFFGRSPVEGAQIVAICKDLWENQNTPPTQERVYALLAEYGEKGFPRAIRALAQDAFQWACYGQHDVGWLAFYNYFQRIGVVNIDMVNGLLQTADCCGWWWPLEKIAVITAFPTELHLDDQGRLHSENSMSIRYADGWGFYSWNGTTVPEDIITNPESITAERIMREVNAELRRVMIERIGAAQFLERAQAIEEHRNARGVLWRVNFPEDAQDSWVAVQLQNTTPEPDGTHKMYVIPVPPETRNVDDALAWMHFCEPGTYRPAQES